MDGRKLDKIRVRYFPPALILEFIDKDKSKDTELIDLLNLNEKTNIRYLLEQINLKEPLTIKFNSKIQNIIESI